MGAQLTGFVVESVQLRPSADVAFDEDEKPVLGLVRFLNGHTQLGGENPAAATSMIIGGHAAARSGELPIYLQGDWIAWQSSEELAESSSDKRCHGQRGIHHRVLQSIPNSNPQILKSL
jgi:hypothetical protein